MFRSTLGGHYAGNGMHLAFCEEDSMYEDDRVHVKLPSDNLKGASLAAMSGPVTCYNVKVVQLQPDCEVCGHRMDQAFLRPFPGAPDVRACSHCRALGSGEVPADVYDYSPRSGR